MRMTKEELRRRMSAKAWMQGKSVEELFLSACTVVQIELHEIDGNKILEMPFYQFESICMEIGKARKKIGEYESDAKKNNVKGVFGDGP